MFFYRLVNTAMCRAHQHCVALQALPVAGSHQQYATEESPAELQNFREVI